MNMLWHKAWLETRWRFLIGFALMVLSAAGTVFTYPQVRELLPLVPLNVQGEIGRRIQEAAELSRTFRGYVWSQAFQQNLSHLVTLFAALLGTGSFLSRSGGALFTLSLPVSRQRLVAVRTAAGLLELFALAMIPPLTLPLLAPAVGASYGVGAALVHGLCLFAASAVFFGVALLFSTVFGDPWRPLLFALAIAFALAVAGALVKAPAWSVYGVMSGETYFRSGSVPWGGLAVSAAAAAALAYGAAASFARRDF
jgi:ABC-type transport system involved in multi-copper enzyme maturation permease subunit